MKILDRYIGQAYIKAFFYLTGFFSFFYLFGDLVGHLEDIIDNKVPFRIVLTYYSAMVPIVLVNIFPLASLLGAMFVVGNMNYRNEIIAVRTAGKGLWYVLRTILVFSLLVGAMTFFVNERFVPSAETIVNTIKRDFIKRNASERKRLTLRNITFYGEDDKLYFLSSFDPSTNVVEGVVILSQDKNHHIVEKWVARRARWKDGKWEFEDLLTYKFDFNGNVDQASRRFYKRKMIDLGESPSEILRGKGSLARLNIRGLWENLRRFGDNMSPETRLTFEVKILSRLLLPFSPLVLVLIGLPFVLQVQRKPVGFAGLGIGMVIFFLYYVAFAFASNFAQLGLVNPYLLLLPVPLVPALFGVLAISLMP